MVHTLIHKDTGSTDSVPNDFHFVFGLKKQRTPFHLVHYLCLASCFDINKPRKVFLHYHYEPYGRYWDLIKERLTLVKVELPSIVKEFKYHNSFLIRHFYRYAHHSDFVRINALNTNGGVYADLDTLFVKKLPAHLFDENFVIGRESPVKEPRTGVVRSSLCNAFIMSKPQSEFGIRYEQAMSATFDGYWSTHSCLLAEDLAAKFPESLHIEPEQSFYKYSWSNEDIDRLLCKCETDMSDVYSFHLWAHLWWSRFRRDVSKFHAAMITENFIRSFDTTYTIFARPHLPRSAESTKRFFGGGLPNLFNRPPAGITPTNKTDG